MNISVQFPAEEAQTDDEKERIWDRGPDKGTFFVSFYIQTHPAKVDGKYDFTEVYPAALREVMALDRRIAEGKHFSIQIIS